MKSTLKAVTSNRVLNFAIAGFCVLLLVLFTGCPTATTPDNPDDPIDDDPVTGVQGEIIGLKQGFPISALEQPISILYKALGDAIDRVDALYLPVADATSGSSAIGEKVLFEFGLLTGQRQSFSFDPSSVDVGFYRLGIQITAGEDVTEYLSDGVLHVQGPPNPRFIQPAQDLMEVTIGTDVAISFDCQDPENDVQWRLFVLTPTDNPSASANQLGTQLATSSGNVGSFVLATDNFTAGDYQVGISATDTGDSISSTVQQGLLTRIVTTLGPIVRINELPPDPLPPSIEVLAPGSTDVTLFMNDAFTVQFTGTVNEPGATGSIDVFYDTDNNFSNGFTPLATAAAPTVTSVAFPTDVPAGTYYIGASITDGISPIVVDYAQGTISVVRTASLTVTAPDLALPIRPWTVDNPTSVAIEWTTDLPAGAGTLDVYAQTLDAAGEPYGAELAILTDATLSTTSASFSSETSGLFGIYVRVDFAAKYGLAPLVEEAPTSVRVSSLPAILWLGRLAEDEPGIDGAIFEGVNFEDNAGTSFTRVNDLNNDGMGEFVINARYGKPFFQNPIGVGPGEAYLIYGQSAGNKLEGVYNLNSVGTELLQGVTFTGVRTPQASNETDGMSSVSRLPDLDGDGMDELIFGFPKTASRGHNVDPEQDGVVDPHSLATLEREDQFLRGGIVMVSSQNNILRSPDEGDPVINLDLVGQDFEITCVAPEPDQDNDFYLDRMSADSGLPCSPGSDTWNDSNGTIRHGFVKALARDYWHSYIYPNDERFGGGNYEPCGSVTQFLGNPCLPYQFTLGFTAACEPSSPGLHRFTDETDSETGYDIIDGRSGFYVYQYEGANNEPVRNDPLPPYGARVIGVGLDDEFGTSMTLSSTSATGAGDIIVSAPGRTARGILLGPLPLGCDSGPDCGGEIDGLESSPGVAKSNPNSGVAYMFTLRSLWTDSLGRIPPKPHQYIVGEASHCGGPAALIDNIDAIRIAGLPTDRITNIVGIDDFNQDGRDDFAIGAPDASSNAGRVYIAFRRQQSIEGDYVLEKLSLDPNNAERLAGVLVVSESNSAFGASLATGVDFNGDGVSDLVIGAPNASAGTGEVIVVFGDPNLVSPMDGISVQTLLTTRNTAGLPRAARITGNTRDTNGQFGFNVANAGDIDGDGMNDLLISAPNATPRFDPIPTDATDVLSEAGVDNDFNGAADDVSGPQGGPDGVIDSFDELTNAGLVYVIYGSNRLDQASITTDITVNIEQLGSNNLRGFIIAGRRTGDRIGGGDAGDMTAGGINDKDGRGRSAGLASAGDVDGDSRGDILIGSILADPRIDPTTGEGRQNGGEAYLIYGSMAP